MSALDRSAPTSIVRAALALSACSSWLLGCLAPFPEARIVSDDLNAMSRGATASHPETFRAILDQSLASDAFVCTPPVERVFFGATPDGTRTLRGTMPHYGVYHGPMHYTVTRHQGRWRVSLIVAVEPPAEGGDLELPDCDLRRELTGPVLCSGAAFSSTDSLDACPVTGTFRAPNTDRNIAALLARWSRDAERYYNRDAAYFGIPIDYDFEFVTASDTSRRAADAVLPLWPTCGRTPYFVALRSGWSLPIVAHEMGHWLGLLDEYEMLSGIVRLYPKTPFAGAEVSRMGLSMRERTLVLPLHHYLILRRYFCPEPASRDPYRGAGI